MSQVKQKCNKVDYTEQYINRDKKCIQQQNTPTVPRQIPTGKPPPESGKQLQSQQWQHLRVEQTEKKQFEFAFLWNKNLNNNSTR